MYQNISPDFCLSKIDRSNNRLCFFCRNNLIHRDRQFLSMNLLGNREVATIPRLIAFLLMRWYRIMNQRFYTLVFQIFLQLIAMYTENRKLMIYIVFIL